MRASHAAAVVVAGLLLACGARISQSSFDKVENDMTREEVIAILGEPTESASIGLGPFEGTSSTWEADGAVITIQFLDGKVKLKHFEKRRAD